MDTVDAAVFSDCSVNGAVGGSASNAANSGPEVS